MLAQITGARVGTCNIRPWRIVRATLDLHALPMNPKSLRVPNAATNMRSRSGRCMFVHLSVKDVETILFASYAEVMGQPGAHIFGQPKWMFVLSRAAIDYNQFRQPRVPGLGY